MEQSAPPQRSTVPSEGTVVRERVTRFLHAKHPIWTAKRVSIDTTKRMRGRGIPPATIAQWDKRGSAPSLEHLHILALTYGIDFLASVFIEVSEVEAAARARELASLEARVAALRQGGVR